MKNENKKTGTQDQWMEALKLLTRYSKGIASPISRLNHLRVVANLMEGAMMVPVNVYKASTDETKVVITPAWKPYRTKRFDSPLMEDAYAEWSRRATRISTSLVPIYNHRITLVNAEFLYELLEVLRDYKWQVGRPGWGLDRGAGPDPDHSRNLDDLLNALTSMCDSELPTHSIRSMRLYAVLTLEEWRPMIYTIGRGMALGRALEEHSFSRHIYQPDMIDPHEYLCKVFAWTVHTKHVLLNRGTNRRK